MKNYSQLEFILKYLKKENINIDLKEFKFQVETHPNFPSLFSFSEALNFFSIKNVSAKISNEDLDYLPDNFISLIQPEYKQPYLTFVEKKDGVFKYLSDGSMVSVSKGNFLNLWKNIVLIVEETEETKTIKSKNISLRWFMFSFFCFLAIVSNWLSNGFNVTTYTSLILNLVGVYLTIEVVKQEFGVKSTLSSAVCNSNSTNISNCESIITSKKAKLFLNYGLSDLCVIFFFGHIISFFLMSITNLIHDFITLSIITLTLSIPVTLFSIYFQWKVENKWCPLCLMIIAVLYIELINYLFYNNIHFDNLNLISISIFIFGFLSFLLSWIISKPIIKKYFDLKSFELESIRFKRNYKLFKLALKDSKKVNYETLKSKVTIGNHNANLKITIITNPFCGYCADAHKILEDIVLKNYDKVLLNIRFHFSPDQQDDNSIMLINSLLRIYFKNNEKNFMNALSFWFENKNFEKWFSIFGNDEVSSNTESILATQYIMNKENGFSFTPAIIIGEYLYPEFYNKNDLPHFIDELTDDEDFLI